VKVRQKQRTRTRPLELMWRSESRNRRKISDYEMCALMFFFEYSMLCDSRVYDFLVMRKGSCSSFNALLGVCIYFFAR
jgi:hypothetical protein